MSTPTSSHAGRDVPNRAYAVRAPQPVSPAERARAARHAQHSSQDRAPRRKRGPVTVLVALLIALALVYAAGVVAFAFILYPNTRIAGIDVSLLTADAAQERLDSATGDYALTIQGDGFTWEYRPEGTRSIFDTRAAVQRRLAQNASFQWPVELYESLSATDVDAQTADTAAAELETEPDLSLLGASFDRTAFERDLGAAVDAFNEGRTGTFNAASAFDAETGTYTVERVHANRKLDRDAIVRLGLHALADLDDTADVAELGDAAFVPLADDLTEERMQAVCDEANALLGTNVTFKLGDSVAGTLDASVINPWITFTADSGPVLDAAAVTTWAEQLAASMNTVGTTRTYTRPDGKQVTVGGGTYGWAVDEDALVQAVQDAVANHQTGEIAVPTSSEGVTYAGPGQPDWGAYADVDLTEQRARYYDASGNLLWETGVVTGKPDGENNTPTGIYYVNNKLRNITLVGKKDPETGEPEYESPVEYWIAFVGSAIGFHDASWQNPSVYNDPTAYTWAGSHGCINTPLDKVIELYNLIQIGDCVIVHN